MSESTLIAHAGATKVSYDALAALPCPAPTATWFPVPHHQVIEAATVHLHNAGFEVARAEYAVARDGGARMFAVMDLVSGIEDGVTLSIGIRNSFDKSLPLGFVAGTRVFVCDNLSFRSDILVKRKHTRFGHDRFREAIAVSVQELAAFQDTETVRVRRLKDVEVAPMMAEALILRSMEEGVVAAPRLADILKEWREPRYAEFQPRTLWSLANAYTTVLGDVGRKNPQRYADLTMKLAGLIDRTFPAAA